MVNDSTNMTGRDSRKEGLGFADDGVDQCWLFPDEDKDGGRLFGERKEGREGGREGGRGERINMLRGERAT